MNRTHCTCPICGLENVPLTGKGNMHKTLKHEKCIGNGKNLEGTQGILDSLSFIDNPPGPFPKEYPKEFFVAALGQNIASNFSDILGDDYLKSRRPKLRKLLYAREHADEFIARFHQAVAFSRAAMGTPQGS